MKKFATVLLTGTLACATGVVFGQQTRNPNQQKNTSSAQPNQKPNPTEPNPGDIPHQTPGSNNPDLQQEHTTDTSGTSPKNTKSPKRKTKRRKQNAASSSSRTNP